MSPQCDKLSWPTFVAVTHGVKIPYTCIIMSRASNFSRVSPCVMHIYTSQNCYNMFIRVYNYGITNKFEWNQSFFICNVAQSTYFIMMNLMSYRDFFISHLFVMCFNYCIFYKYKWNHPSVIGSVSQSTHSVTMMHSFVCTLPTITYTTQNTRNPSPLNPNQHRSHPLHACVYGANMNRTILKCYVSI